MRLLKKKPSGQSGKRLQTRLPVQPAMWCLLPRYGFPTSAAMGQRAHGSVYLTMIQQVDAAPSQEQTTLDENLNRRLRRVQQHSPERGCFLTGLTRLQNPNLLGCYTSHLTAFTYQERIYDCDVHISSPAACRRLSAASLRNCRFSTRVQIPNPNSILLIAPTIERTRAANVKTANHSPCFD